MPGVPDMSKAARPKGRAAAPAGGYDHPALAHWEAVPSVNVDTVTGGWLCAHFPLLQRVHVLARHPRQPALDSCHRELARALGYKDERSVRQASTSVTPMNSPKMMTQAVVNLDHGCQLERPRPHLLPARLPPPRHVRPDTPVAKAFRRWVLDVIEQYGDRVPAEQPVTLSTPSTPADRKPLRSLVNAWAKLANIHQSTLWPQVRAHFQLERIDNLPVEWLPDTGEAINLAEARSLAQEHERLVSRRVTRK